MSDPRSILVVDDHADICAFISAALEGAGFDVRSAPEGAQAVALQRRQPADLLITDLFMPVQEGFETIAMFQAEFPRTAIIAMSAGSARGMKLDYLKAGSLAGVDGVLHKPFSADELLHAVHSALSKH